MKWIYKSLELEKYVVSVLCFYLLIYLSSCGKCFNSDTTVKNISSPIEQYFGAYKTGNYWIFKSNKGILDTLIVSAFKQDTSRGSNCERYEVRDLAVESKTWSQNNTIKLYSSIDIITSNSLSSVFTLQTNVNNNFTSTVDSFKQSIPLIDSMLINSQTFKKVLPFITGETIKTKFFVAPNIGFIRWENKNDTFTLINFKIK